MAVNLGSERRTALGALCEQFALQGLYAFGSRSRQALDWLDGRLAAFEPGSSDLDIGVKPSSEETPEVRQTVELTLALEDLFGVSRVDLVWLPQVDPFLAANIIRGERLYAQDTYLADEYDLYILRRAGDLAFLERDRLELIEKGIR